MNEGQIEDSFGYTLVSKTTAGAGWATIKLIDKVTGRKIRIVNIVVSSEPNTSGSCVQITDEDGAVIGHKIWIGTGGGTVQLRNIRWDTAAVTKDVHTIGTADATVDLSISVHYTLA